MKLIKEEKISQNLKTKEFIWQFEVEKGGIYGIEILASVKSWWQNFLKLKSFFKDDDLTLKIDDISFPKKSNKRGLFDSEVAWNGNNLKGLKKTNFFLVYLQEGTHNLNFLVGRAPFLETIRIYQIEESEISFLPKDNLLPQDGNQRQWLTIVLVNIGLDSLKIRASAKEGKKFLTFQKDDSDLKLIINGKVQINEESKSHRYWYWCGRTLKGKSKEFNKELNLSSGLHYFELWADRSPEVEEIKISGIERKNFGKVVLYQDIEKTDFVNLRGKPRLNEDNIIAKLNDGERVEILKEREIGDWGPYKSYIWHEIRCKDKTGYVLSSFVEIEGQEREIIIEKIRRKAEELNIDEDLVLALVGCESRYKPYATSRPFEEKEGGEPIAAKGIFQLTKAAVNQLKINKGIYYFEIRDYFDIGQNIEGGIRYLKWLYDTFYKGKEQEIEKLIAAYNAGQNYIPVDLPLDYSQIPSDRKREEAKQLVKCVIENKKRKSWNYIILSLFIFLLISIGGFGMYYLNQIDFFEPVLSEKEYLLSQVSRFPSALWEEEKDQIIFFNSQKKIVKRISAQKLHLNEILQAAEEFKKYNTSIYIYPEVLEYPKNTFYFLVSNNLNCGQNCRWVFLKYDVKKDKINIVDEDIFGLGVDLYPSPNLKKIAVATYIFGGFCNSGGDLKIIDLKNGYQKEKITGFENEDYITENIESLRWRNNNEIEIKVNQGCSQKGSLDRERVFIYDLENKSIKLMREKYFQPDQTN